MRHFTREVPATALYAPTARRFMRIDTSSALTNTSYFEIGETARDRLRGPTIEPIFDRIARTSPRSATTCASTRGFDEMI